jgi:hypothetical protein
LVIGRERIWNRFEPTEVVRMGDQMSGGTRAGVVSKV